MKLSKQIAKWGPPNKPIRTNYIELQFSSWSWLIDEVAQLEASEEYWHGEANEQMGLKLKAMAENERLLDKIEILKMVVMESPEALKLVRAILYEHTKKDALKAGEE